MNNIQSAIDPNKQLFVSGSALAATRAENSLDSRQLFYNLIHISEHYSVLPVARDFVEQTLASIREPSQIKLSDNVDVETLQIKLKQPIRLDFSLAELKKTKALLVELAPVILTTPSWLQNISQAATCDTEIAVDLFAVYLQLVQQIPGRLMSDHHYKTLLLTYGLDLPGVSTWAFAQQEQVSDAMFDLGALQLALAQFPRIYLSEILGFTLAYCQTIEIAGSLAKVQLRTSHQGVENFLSTQHQLAAAQIPVLKQIIQRYLQDYADQEQALWQRIQQGHGLYRQYFERCLQQLQRQLQSSTSPRRVLVKLLRRVAPKAAGHHGRIQLGGKNLDVWFTQQPFASEKFLSALRESAYVDKQHPGQSQLLKLFDFSGPMFGVLNAQERQVLKDWLIYPNGDNNGTEAVQKKLATPIRPVANAKTQSEINFARLSNRQLYFYLVNADLYPEVFVTARDRVQRLLAKTRWLTRLPFKHYQHPLFDELVDNHYQQEMGAYNPFKAPPKLSRKTYVWGIEQLAPTVLTDGCWLQGASQLQFYSNRKVGAYLFSTYSDEVGAGKRDQSHPYIYRQLLQSLDIALPPTHSQEFVEHLGFIDSAFDLPNYLLAIGRFPGQFLPEILGLNLAIELSGLGKLYMTLADELDYWGIDPAIVNIHISIDNAVTGHTALATRAIQLYLDGILASQGTKGMNKHWRRIYTGYCSLRWASARFKYSLVLKYLQKRSALK